MLLCQLTHPHMEDEAYMKLLGTTLFQRASNKDPSEKQFEPHGARL